MCVLQTDTDATSGDSPEGTPIGYLRCALDLLVALYYTAPFTVNLEQVAVYHIQPVATSGSIWL